MNQNLLKYRALQSVKKLRLEDSNLSIMGKGSYFSVNDISQQWHLLWLII